MVSFLKRDSRQGDSGAPRRTTQHPSQVEGSISEGISLCDGKASGLIKRMEGNRCGVPVAFQILQVIGKAFSLCPISGQPERRS